MNRHNKGRSSHADKIMESQKGRKRRDEGNSKAHTTSTASTVNGPVTLRKKKKAYQLKSGKNRPTGTRYEGGIFCNVPAQQSTSSSDFFTSNQKDQTEKSVSSIIQHVKTSEHAVTAETSSTKYLRVYNEKHQHSDSEADCCFGTILNTGPYLEDDRTQQNKRDVQNNQSVQTSSQTSELPSKGHCQKRPLLIGPPVEQTFTEANSKKKRTSDHNLGQNLAQTEAEVRNEFNPEVNKDKPQLHLAFKAECMNGFWKDASEIFELKGGQNVSPMFGQTFIVCTSWEGCAIEHIKKIATESKKDVNFDITENTPIEIADFSYYAKIVHGLIDRCPQQDIFFKVGSYVVCLQSNDLYCCPVSQDEKKINFPHKKLSYATLKTSVCFNKNYSETGWNYILGNYGKVSSRVKTPQDAIAVCAVLFSEVIRYPNMFFHNILMMQHFKTWNEFCDYHPMVGGGTWKCQGGSKNIAKKVIKREQENLVICVKKMLGDKEKTSTPFQLEIVTAG